MAKKETFVLNTSYVKRFSNLSNEQFGILFRAISEYEDTGELTIELDDKTETAFTSIKFDLDENRAKYDNTCKERQKASKQAVEARKVKDNQEQPNGANDNHLAPNDTKCYQQPTDNDFDFDLDNDFDFKDPPCIPPLGEKRAKKPSRFEKPTVEDVKKYCAERKNGINAQHFIDHYTSNGWKVGKNAMRDWKAAVRTWERNGVNRASPGKKGQDFDERTYSPGELDALIRDPLAGMEDTG